MRKPIIIGRNAAVLWTMRTDGALEEQERYRRLPGEAQRQLFLLAHVFLRHALSSQMAGRVM